MRDAEFKPRNVTLVSEAQTFNLNIHVIIGSITVKSMIDSFTAIYDTIFIL